MLWRRRRWRRLLNLIHHLPAASHYAEAQANDEELARAYLEHLGDDGPLPEQPRVSEWDPLRAELANLTDRVGELIAITVVAHGGDKVNVRPRPRPVTAVDRIREQVRVERHQRLVSRLLRQ